MTEPIPLARHSWYGTKHFGTELLCRKMAPKSLPMDGKKHSMNAPEVTDITVKFNNASNFRFAVAPMMDWVESFLKSNI